MQCLRCGNKIPATEVFCPECLQHMTDFPVRTDVAIQIPVRPAIAAEKPSRKKKSYADYVRTLRRLIKALCVLVVILTLLLCAACALLYHMTGNGGTVPEIGKNYTTEQTNTP